MKKLPFLLCIIAFAFFGCKDSEKKALKSGSGDEIVFGTIFSLSGKDSYIGTEIRDGAMLAFQRINQRGGVLSKRLGFLSEDDESNEAKALETFNQLTSENGVKFIVGPNTFEPAIAVAGQAQQNQVVFISPSVSDEELTKVGDYVFRVIFTNYRQGIVGADFAYDNLQSRRAAILYNSEVDYSTGLADGFRTHFNELGGSVVADESYKIGDESFDAQIARIKAGNPDVIYLPNDANDAVKQAKELRAQGISIPLVGGDAWDNLADIGGDEVLNCFYTISFATETTDIRGGEFRKSFTNRYVRPPSHYAALGYDAIYLLADAINAAGSLEPAAVKDAMTKINGIYETGAIRFDANRNPVKGAMIVEITKNDSGGIAKSSNVIIGAK
jgi:branched-chain amino acid transport system substrate-binding protein